jgi:uncharacterized protein (DUF305 family)
MTRWMLAIGLLALVAVVPSALADEPVEGRGGRAELRFLEGMIDHHQMALDMANDCLNNSSDAAVTTLCQAIIDAQSAEIAQMQGWLAAWYNVDYQPMSMLNTADDGMEDMDHSDHSSMNMGGLATDPAMTMGMMAGLNRLDGVEYDIAWLESMIDHHDDAIHMSERVLERAEHDELRILAQAIIDAQSAEIRQMESLILTHGG